MRDEGGKGGGKFDYKSICNNKKIIIKNYYSLKEYSKFMSERAVLDVGMIPTPEALEILHSKAAVDTGEDYRFALPGEVLMGTRQPEELPFATEIATFFRTQIETIETIKSGR